MDVLPEIRRLHFVEHVSSILANSHTPNHPKEPPHARKISPKQCPIVFLRFLSQRGFTVQGSGLGK